MSTTRLSRSQRIYHPDTGKFLAVLLGDPRLNNPRIIFEDACGTRGVLMSKLLEHDGSTMHKVLKGANDGILEMPTYKKITLIGTVSPNNQSSSTSLPDESKWSEYRKKSWIHEIDLGERRISRAELARQAARLYESVVMVRLIRVRVGSSTEFFSQELQNEGNDSPYITDKTQSRHLVNFSQMVLTSLEKTSSEDDDDKHWWQIMFAVDVSEHATSK
ncbi:hypothetical protein AX15_007028 [Amanita polypyramis BW_CC]|nr:hypothetical protein AX15_007028 [Amanita polypyramis BW_CC]